MLPAFAATNSAAPTAPSASAIYEAVAHPNAAHPADTHTPAAHPSTAHPTAAHAPAAHSATTAHAAHPVDHATKATVQTAAAAHPHVVGAVAPPHPAVPAGNPVLDPATATLLNIVFATCLANLGPNNSLSSPALYNFVNQSFKEEAPIPVSLKDNHSIIVSGPDAVQIGQVQVYRPADKPSLLQISCILSVNTVTLHLSVPPAHPELVFRFRGPLKIDLDCSSFPVLHAVAQLDEKLCVLETVFSAKPESDWLHKAAAAVQNAVMKVDAATTDISGHVKRALIAGCAKPQSFDVDLVPKKNDAKSADATANPAFHHKPGCTCHCAQSK